MSRFASSPLLVAGRVPEAESTEEGVGIVAQTAVARKLLQFFGVATAEHDFIRFQRGHQTPHDVGYITAPFLFSAFFQTAYPNIVLVSCLLIGRWPSSIGSTIPSTTMQVPRPVPRPRKSILPFL